MNFTYGQIAKLIDHSLLQPSLTDTQLEEGCRVALKYDVASVCIKPYYLARAVTLLANSMVKASTTIGFPHGSQTTRAKLAELQEALELGAQELDVVVNIGKVLSADWTFVASEVAALVEMTHARGQVIKVIFENSYLEDVHKIRLCEICAEVRADFIKTSTGYSEGGATLHDLQLMRRHSPPFVQIKAAGGVRTLDKLLEVRELGVSRVGASRTAEMLDECRRRLLPS